MMKTNVTVCVHKTSHFLLAKVILKLFEKEKGEEILLQNERNNH